MTQQVGMQGGQANVTNDQVSQREGIANEIIQIVEDAVQMVIMKYNESKPYNSKLNEEVQTFVKEPLSHILEEIEKEKKAHRRNNETA